MKTALFAALTLAYPLSVWLLGGRFEPKWLALTLLAVAAVRVASSRDKVWWAVGAAALVLALLTWVLNTGWPLRWYPVVINAALLSVFGVSLRSGPPVVERLARLRTPNLPTHAIAYTRTVTKVWCGFFVVNGAIAAATALWGTDAQWAAYNGGIAYGLIGVVGGVEWLVRRRVQARHGEE